MPCLGFKSTTPVFERKKTVDAVGRAANAISMGERKYIKHKMRVSFLPVTFSQKIYLRNAIK
jgi:hypothetical protein